MVSLEETLSERREAWYRRVGQVHEGVVSRVSPVGGSIWPGSALGCMRVVTRGESLYLVTDGLSTPYDPELHSSPPPGPLDFELALILPRSVPEGRDAGALAESWLPSALYAVTDWLVPEWFDLRSFLEQFRVVTLASPATNEVTQALAGEDGLFGALVGMPLVGANIDAHVYLQGLYAGLGSPYDGAAVGVFPIKPLTRDEHAWAKARGDDGGVALAERFYARGDGPLSWAGRPSVLEHPRLSPGSPTWTG